MASPLESRNAGGVSKVSKYLQSCFEAITVNKIPAAITAIYDTQNGGLVFICWNGLMVSYIWSSFIYSRKWKEIESFLKAVLCSNWYSSNASLSSDNLLNGFGQDFH